MTGQDNNITPARYDIRMLFPVFFLVGIGIVMVYSASSALALKKYSSDYFFVKKQVTFAIAGFCILAVCRFFPYRLYRSFAYVLLIASAILLAAVSVSSFGHTAGGATRWLRLGEFSFQPSEFARFAMIVYLAYSLNKKQSQVKDFYIGFLPHVIILGILTALILMQPDFGSVVILGVITWAMMFTGGVKISHLLLPLIGIMPVAAWFMMNAEYRLKRVMSFIDPWQYPTGEGYQIIHSLMAFGSGGLFGSGFGQGYQKLFYLPEPHTDFIISVIGEETGLVGITIILVLYGLIIYNGISIALKTEDRFGSFLATGLTVAMGLQVCINMGVALGLLPAKGLTLPFLSYGGTSLLMNLASIGILLNIGASKIK